MTDWFDGNGMIHLNPGEDSDNGILFTVEYLILKKLEGALTGKDIVRFVQTGEFRGVTSF